MNRCIVAALFLCATAFAQAPQPKPAFAVVSIKPSPPPDPNGMSSGFGGGPGSGDPGRWSCFNMTLTSLVMNAYSLRSYELKAPDWMKRTLFDVNAKVPEGATKDDLKLMLQGMLAERFKLTFHRESKEAQGYELQVAKGGPTLTPASPAEPGAAPKLDSQGRPMPRPGASGMTTKQSGEVVWRGSSQQMSQFAAMLGSQLQTPVADATTIAGRFDIELSWQNGPGRAVLAATADGMPAPSTPGETGPTLFAALHQQLGLRLEAKKVTISVLVVDSAEKTPTEN